MACNCLRRLVVARALGRRFPTYMQESGEHHWQLRCGSAALSGTNCMRQRLLCFVVGSALTLSLLSGCDQEGNLSLSGKAEALQAASTFDASTRPMLSGTQAISTLLQGTGLGVEGQASLPAYSVSNFSRSPVPMRSIDSAHPGSAAARRPRLICPASISTSSLPSWWHTPVPVPMAQ